MPFATVFFSTRVVFSLYFYSSQFELNTKIYLLQQIALNLVTRLLVFCMLYLNYGADLEAMIHLAHRSNSFETTCQALDKAN